MKVGVIGVGLAGKAHVETLNARVAGADVVALADIAEERARAVAASCPGKVTTYADPLALIASADVEAVVVTTIAETHADLVLACIAAGKPVFCEKPLGVTAEETDRIVKAEIGSGRHLVQVGFMRRFDAGYRHLREIAASGAIGEIVAVHNVHRNPSVPASFTSEMHTTEALIHEIDVLRWLVDDEYAQVTVDAVGSAGELLDPQFFRFTTRQGRHIDVEVFVNAGFGYQIGCELVGRAGVASLPGPSTPLVSAAGGRTQHLDADFRTRFADAFRDELIVWLDDAARGEVTGPNAWDGHVAAVVSDACLRALHSRRPESIALPDRPSFY